ncbi:MAG: hypothetical protein JXR03_17160 [Cyclobacteriaceae bacterium]
MRLILTFLILLTARVLLAQCCSGGVPMSSNLGMPSADRGTFQFDISYDLNNLQTLKQGTNTLNDDTRERQTHSVLLKFGYSFNDKFSVDGFVSYVRQERTISTLAEEDFTSTNGVGDGVVMLKYSPIEGLTSGYGIKVPLGKSDIGNLNADLQPGSGAWDQIFYLSYTGQFKFRPSLTYFGTSIYRLTGVNKTYFVDSQYEFGDEFQILGGISDRFLIGNVIIDPSLKLRYRHAGRDRFDNGNFPGSGGSFVFMSPAISWRISPVLNYHISAELPIYARVKETQLSPTFRINTGIGYTIKPKKLNTIKI